MLLQHVYGIIHVKRGLAQKNAAYVSLHREEWIVELWVKTAT